MAYLQPQDDEEKQADKIQAQAPGSVASGSSGGMVQGGMSGALAPQQTPQQQSGSGNFTNLKSWLDAGKGRDQNISTTGNKLLGTESTTLANKTTGALADVDKNKSIAVSASDDPGYENVVGDLTKAAQGDQDAKSRLFDVTSQQYKGPTATGYDPTSGQSFQNLKGVDALSATNTVGAQLAGETPYNAGARRLDNSVYSADAASQKAIAGNKQGGIDLLKKAVTSDQQVADAAAARKADIDYQRGMANSLLGGQATNIYQDIAAKVKAAQDADTATQAKLNDAIDNRTTRTVTQGNGATEGNIITGDQASQLDLLGRLVGARTISKTGEYTPWAVNDVTKPDPIQDIVDARMNEDVPYVSPYTNTVQDPVAKAQTTQDSAYKQETLYAALNSGVYGKATAADGTVGMQDPDTGEVISVKDVMNGTYTWDPESKRLKRSA